MSERRFRPAEYGTKHSGRWYVASEPMSLPEAQRVATMANAAPDMLAALENLESDDGAIPDHAWALVQQAIAKAKGAP